jgi:Tfp pilus assembly protein PilF
VTGFPSNPRGAGLPARADELLDAALRRLQAGDRAGADLLISQVLQTDPRNVRAHTIRGILLRQGVIWRAAASSCSAPSICTHAI